MMKLLRFRFLVMRWSGSGERGGDRSPGLLAFMQGTLCDIR
jgi:hypothetical protein